MFDIKYILSRVAVYVLCGLIGSVLWRKKRK